METLQTNKPQQNLHEIIQRVASAALFSLDFQSEKQLLSYFQELDRWNRVINLSGIRDQERLVIKHLGDSLLVLKHVALDADGLETVLDVGTGAGIPGLVMKIIRPELYMVLAEAVKKKCSFLRFVCAGLKLRDIYIEQGLISSKHPPDHLPDGGFQLIISQAAGSVKWFVDTALDFLAPGGRMLILKGPAVREELKDLSGFFQALDLEINVIESRLPLLNHRRLLVEITRTKP